MTTTTDRVIAYDRPETDSCERGTPGCCIDHTREYVGAPDRRDGECETW